MCAKKLEDILTFKREYPGHLLQPFRQLVVPVGVYDECARDMAASDALALFDLLELSGMFSPAFADELFALSKVIFDFIQSNMAHLSPGRRAAFSDRLNRSLLRIGRELSEEGYPMVYQLFREVIAIIHHHHNEKMIQEHSVVAEHERRRQRLLSQRAVAGPPEREDIGWHMLAYNVQQTVAYSPIGGILQSEAMRQVLRTVDLDLEGQDRLRVNSEQLPWGLHHYQVTIIATDHPLSLCKVNFIHRTKQHLSAVAEVRRSDGHLTFQACSFLRVEEIFKKLLLENAYGYLRDLVTVSIFQALTEGVIDERRYLLAEEGDALAGEAIQEESPSLDSAPGTPPETLTLPTIAEIERVRVGRSRLSYRNIIATLLRWGVRIVPGGRHLKLELNGVTSPFLNPHRHQNPDHNRRVLREVLNRLDINEQDFMAALTS